jgi:peptidoglycan hydrolase-like amidase
LPNDVQAYYVAVDYTVDSNDQYYRNGTNYRLVTVGRFGDAWRVMDFEVAPVYDLRAAGYGFDTQQELQVATEQQQLVSSSLVVPPDHINVLLLDGNNCGLLFGEAPECFEVYSAPFLEYQKDTLPPEWWVNTAPEALKAGAMAIKMFAWYHHVSDPKFPTYGADLSDDSSTSQVYRYLSRSEPYNTAVNAVERIAMFAQNDSMFEPQYRDSYLGDQTVAGPRSGGIMYQYGSHVLANQGYLYQDILRYYYLNSTSVNPNGLVISSLLFPTYSTISN